MPGRARFLDSLQGRLLTLLFAVLALLLGVNSYHAYREALAAANTAYDRSLLAVARVIAERIDLADGKVTVQVPYVALDFFEADLRGRVFYRVSGLDGEFVSGFDDLPPPPANAAMSQEYFALARFYDGDYRGSPVRTVALLQPVSDEQRRGMAMVQVAETLDSRANITGRLLRGTLLREVLIAALVALVIPLGVRLALRPVKRLRDDLTSREASDLSPLDSRSVPSEVRPIVEGMNDYMRRLRELLDAQERFIADAAHQLRTPLTLVNTQAEMALREADAARTREIVAAIHASVGETVRLANQLLGHARATHSLAHAEMADVDLAAIARQAALELAPLAVQRGMDMSYDGAASAHVRGDAVLLQELVRNLVDNAIRYGPERGQVAIRVVAEQDVVLEVVDSGAGIPVHERERVFEPFVRGEDAAATGAGLGLAIVRDAARAHGARIALDTPATGKGFRVSVRFARAA